MTAEYVLVLALFVMFVMSALITGPHNAFKDAGPKLGARVEKQLATGEGFLVQNGRKVQWEQ